MPKPIDEYTKEERDLIESLLLRLNLKDLYGHAVTSWSDACRVYRQNETEEARWVRILDIARQYGGMMDDWMAGTIGKLNVFEIAVDAADHVGLYTWNEARDGIKRRQPTDEEFERFCEAFMIRCTAAKVSQQ